MTKVLFVCLGNICRSPLAEGLFNHLIHEKGYENRLEGHSAGTSSYHLGSQPDERMQEKALEHGITLDHEARQFISEDLGTFDYILPMDQENYEDILFLANDDQKDKIRMIREFDPDVQIPADAPELIPEVPDPYFGGIQGFEEVYQILYRCNKELIAFLEKEHQLKNA